MSKMYTVLSIVVLSIVMPLMGHAQEVLTPAADSYVRGGDFSNDNYGAEEKLDCKLGGSDEWTRETYLKFDLSSLTEPVVVSAILRLKVAQGGGGGDIDTHTAFFVADDSWVETSITWDNKPTPGAELGGERSPAKDAWLEIDLTDQVEIEYEGDQVISLALSSSGEEVIYYHSKEAVSSDDRPQLVLVMSNDQVAPAAPVGLSATVLSDSEIDLTWNASAEGDLAHYNIMRSSDNGSTYTQIAEKITATSYSDIDLLPSTTYFYTVTAVDDSRNESDASSAVSKTTDAPPAPPAAPTVLAVVSSTGYQVNLTWTDNATNERGFSLERKTTGDFAEVEELDEDLVSFSDKELNPSTTYIYRIRAFNAGGNSAYSNEVSVTTTAPDSYYVDAISGDDGHAGTSEGTAWKTLQKVSSHTFLPGEKVLFKTGSVWNERLTLNGSGIEGSPIIVDMYGTGNKPIFNGGGGSQGLPTVFLENAEYWEINNLEITNSDGSNTYQSNLWGIMVDVTEAGEFNHIYIRNCYIHMINGEVSLADAPNEGKETGGITVTVSSGSSDPAWYRDLKIQNNRIGGELGGDLVSGMGISTESTHGKIQLGEDRKLFQEVVVTENVIGPTGRNNAVIRVSEKALVEHNLFKDSSRKMTGHNVYNYNTLDFVIQYNEAYGNVGPSTDKDRGGYDADYQSQNTYIQYNYSHDNNWTLGIMKRATNENVVFRYNIAQNDKHSVFRYGFNSDRGLTDAHVYNNTFYVSSDYTIEVFGVRTALNTEFYNNIFYFENEATWGTSTQGLPINCTFENNCFYNISPKGTNYLTTNPSLVDPGTGGEDIDWDEYPNILQGYKLQETSICIDAGKVIENNGGQDFWGNALYNGLPDIGAHEYAEEKLVTATVDVPALVLAYPNPFVDEVNFNLPVDAESVVIYDMSGKSIANLNTDDGSKTLTWRPAANDSTGTLIYHINRRNGDAITGKLIRK
ncbi:DNRLRE domain-containing protein [Reichenbachiella carrageenanivorans]|uniref:DNRLRE domain-containing protein n=1 Tax=Reichenbachiella carrageenanivorans TaxID=2979869 RepID=A0ABY6CUZ9_9BACT|nr:DNRLRE domain-containing protein [Reichenbachiella carrageenanivorans]UXX77693.1 DNRLRE domain-containing protein [Reichenbachiella carrageenanivorans]